ncbi:MAG: hypothetical protein IT377_17660 [Polyangiaceae bacterium]|nr:hypothetical protein [Polyangiaceae bacterium]
MQRREVLALVLASLAAACAPGGGLPPQVGGSARTRSEARARLRALSRRYEQLMSEHGLFEWSRYAGRLAEGPEASARMEKLRAAEREVFVEADEILTRFGDRVVSPRSARLWRRGALGLRLLGDARAAKLGDELERVINEHRFVDDGRPITRAELGEMRRSEDPRVRRRTRHLEHQLHLKAAPIAVALIRRRREIARELGRPSFYAALLEVRGAHLPTVERVLGDLDRRSRRPLADALGGGRGRRLSRTLISSWDVDHLVHRQAVVPHPRFPADRARAVVEGIFAAFGFDLRQNPLDLTVRDFAFGGQTIAITAPDDVRLVLRPLPGIRFYGLLLHEIGHAVAVRSTQATEPLYKGYEWVPGLLDPAFAEGSAELFGRLLDEPRVLREHLGLGSDEIETVLRARRLETLVSVRRGLVGSIFERLALEREGVDLDLLSLDVERNVSGFFVPRDAEPVWATSPFLATYPVYTQSYQLAACVAVQVRDALKARFGEAWLSPRAGDFLRRHFLSDGARWSLTEKMVVTTGAELDSTSLLRQLFARN